MAKRPQVNTEHVNLLMPAPLLRRVRNVAHKNKLTVSQVIRDAVNEGLKELE